MSDFDDWGDIISGGPGEESYISLNNVCFNIGDKEIINDVTLDFKAKDSVVILGLTGSGKSILLKLCAGIYSPSSGTVLVDDIDINKVKRLNRLEIIKNFGFIFQTGGLIGNLTLEENISLSLRYHETFSEDEIRKRVSEKLKEFHLEKAGHLYPASLSPGMRKIVSIIRGMIHSAKVLFLDEPTESVDNYMIRKLIDIIKNHAASGGIVITVTHNQDFADAIANKIAVIDEGKLLAFDQPKTIKSSSNPKLKRILQSMSKDKELADEFLKIMQSDIL